jgi:hypothetical protein
VSNGLLPYANAQLIDAAMARALHADACRDHALVAWVQPQVGLEICNRIRKRLAFRRFCGREFMLRLGIQIAHRLCAVCDDTASAVPDDQAGLQHRLDHRMHHPADRGGGAGHNPYCERKTAPIARPVMMLPPLNRSSSAIVFLPVLETVDGDSSFPMMARHARRVELAVTLAQIEAYQPGITVKARTGVEQVDGAPRRQ